MNNFNQFWNKDNNQKNTQNQQAGQQQANSQQANSQTTPEEPSLIKKLLHSCAPVLMEQFIGGQAMPPVGMPPVGGNPMQTQILSEVLMLQQQIINNQQVLDQRLARLENNASQQFTNLVNQVQSIRSVRLSHEKKQIEFNGNTSDFDKSRQFNGNQNYNQE